jgi:hypothetical protein
MPDIHFAKGENPPDIPFSNGEGLPDIAPAAKGEKRTDIAMGIRRTARPYRVFAR